MIEKLREVLAPGGLPIDFLDLSQDEEVQAIKFPDLRLQRALPFLGGEVAGQLTGIEQQDRMADVEQPSSETVADLKSQIAVAAEEDCIAALFEEALVEQPS